MMYSAVELKFSAVHFLAGKAVSALLTLIILLLLIRILSTEEYGMYVLLVAGMELVMAVLSFGLPWLAARYLPEFRLHGGGLVVPFVWRIIALLACALVVGSTVLFFVGHWLLPVDLLHYAYVVRLFLFVLLLEGLSRYIRENILGPLMQQKIAQITLVIRNFVVLALIGIFFLSTEISLWHVICAEIFASALGLALLFKGLARHLNTYRNRDANANWVQPDWNRMWRVARNMYFNNLIILTYSPQVLILLTQRYLGIEATALFGFLCKLYLQIVNYLPATLLFSLIQPKLVASYIHAGNMSELVRNANLAGKLSLFVLMPLVASVWLIGDELLNLLSDGKFVLSGNYMTGLMVAMIPFSQRRILETIAVTIDKNHIILFSGFLGVFSLPIAYGLIQMEYGLWGPVIAMVVSQIFFNAVIVYFLVYNTTYRPDSIGFLKLMAAALSVFVVAYIPFPQSGGWLYLIGMVLCVTGFFLLTAYFLKPFRSEERDRLNGFFKKKLFVW